MRRQYKEGNFHGKQFCEMIDRRNTASLKWDVEENELPMWVADMDFATAPCVLEAMKKRLNHGIFGYTVIPGTMV